MDSAVTIVVGSKVYRPLIDERLTDEDIRVAREELNETENNRESVLNAFKEKLSHETEFVPRTDDSYLLGFLRTRKFDCERALKLIRENYKFRAKYPAVFPAPSTVEKTLKLNIFNYLPHRDHKGRAIYVVKLGLWDPDEFSFDDFVASGNMLSEYVLMNPVTQINGYVAIWDFRGFSLKQFLTICSPKNVWMFSNIMQDRIPGRFKVVYCINCHDLVNATWNVFKPFTKEKFRKRVQILDGDMAHLHQFIDPEVLPLEFGGTQPPSNCEDIVDKILKKEQCYNYNRKFGYPKKVQKAKG